MPDSEAHGKGVRRDSCRRHASKICRLHGKQAEYDMTSPTHVNVRTSSKIIDDATSAGGQASLAGEVTGSMDHNSRCNTPGSGTSWA